MAKKITAVEGFFGGRTYYDEHGKKIGYSEPGFFGGVNHYDASGYKVGHSDPGFFGGMNHYDILFYLDEPQVLPDKATRARLEAEEGWAAARYIPHHNYEVDPLILEDESASARRIGWIPVATREQRNAMLSALSDDDLSMQGVFVQNPMLGDLPSKREILEEIDEILMTM